MYFAYILLLKNTNLYAGYTDNLKRRLSEHLAGKVKSTRNRRPLKLIYYEAFVSKEDARRREKYFKTTKGKSTLRLMLRETLII
ncbi:MAG: GIY-YIG nuclease family protein [Candidatus Parcubacteria bacterium]|nr:GIY-YIG nuclease family protein [Candidatus Parcubacteria bacterium]